MIQILSDFILFSNFMFTRSLLHMTAEIVILHCFVSVLIVMIYKVF